MTQFLRDQASDTEEVVTPLMQDGTYLSRNFATLGPLTLETPCVSLVNSCSNPHQRSCLNVCRKFSLVSQKVEYDRNMERTKDQKLPNHDSN